MREIPDKYWTYAVCVVLTAVTFAVFWQVRSFEFTTCDDDRYVSENNHILTGLTLDNIAWAFTQSHSFMWHPITSISHMLDCQLFGLNAGRHHIVNLLFHIANTLLLFGILKKMTGRMWPSAFVAALFALHPLECRICRLDIGAQKCSKRLFLAADYSGLYPICEKSRVCKLSACDFCLFPCPDG